jgi:hypothetical protein
MCWSEKPEMSGALPAIRANFMKQKIKLGTLSDRLSNVLTDEKKALQQLKKSGLPLSEYGEKLLTRLENSSSVK